MKTAVLTFNLLSYWHAGTGLRRGGDADALIQRDAHGLPVLPGRTVKGLLRDGVQVAADWETASGIPSHAADAIFGQRSGKPYGPVTFIASDATLAPEFVAWLRSNCDVKAGLIETFASTALAERDDANPESAGQARGKTLRAIELCVPLPLVARIEWDEAAIAPVLTSTTVFSVLQLGARLIRALGAHRHRGLGRCEVTLTLEP